MMIVTLMMSVTLMFRAPIGTPFEKGLHLTASKKCLIEAQQTCQTGSSRSHVEPQSPVHVSCTWLDIVLAFISHLVGLNRR